MTPDDTEPLDPDDLADLLAPNQSLRAQVAELRRMVAERIASTPTTVPVLIITATTREEAAALAALPPTPPPPTSGPIRLAVAHQSAAEYLGSR